MADGSCTRTARHDRARRFQGGYVYVPSQPRVRPDPAIGVGPWDQGSVVTLVEPIKTPLAGLESVADVHPLVWRVRTASVVFPGHEASLERVCRALDSATLDAY